jgi:hypothetical protein
LILNPRFYFYVTICMIELLSVFNGKFYVFTKLVKRAFLGKAVKIGKQVFTKKFNFMNTKRKKQSRHDREK